MTYAYAAVLPMKNEPKDPTTETDAGMPLLDAGG